MSAENTPAQQAQTRVRSQQSKANTRKRRKKHQRIRPQPMPIEPDAYYDAPQLAARWGVHPITIWGWSREKKIPRPTKLGPNISRWLGRTILEHEQRCQQS